MEPFHARTGHPDVPFEGRKDLAGESIAATEAEISP